MSKFSLVVLVALVVLVDMGSAGIWKRQVSDQQLLQEIRDNDRNGDGELNVDELMTTLPPGSRINRQQVAQVLRMFDANRNGSLDLNEVKSLMQLAATLR